jgi:preprotein translocase subunit SecG
MNKYLIVSIFFLLTSITLSIIFTHPYFYDLGLGPDFNINFGTTVLILILNFITSIMFFILYKTKTPQHRNND